MYSYTQGGLVTRKRLSVLNNAGQTSSLDTSQTYDSQGRLLTVKYPDTWLANIGTQTGPTYTYAYDGMGRPISLTDNQTNPVTWVNNVTYGLSGELLTLNGETRTYNSRLQLTNITVSGGTMNIDYRYSSNQNNGQITQQKDWNSGEEVTYTYDSLQRLIGAVTTDSSWGQSFTYDGFGNRTSEAVTKGSAPYGNWSYDPATNRVIGQSYDANGNLGVGSYDVENRLVSVAAAYNPNNQYQNELYAYAPDNKRIWKRKADGTEELYFYGISGQHLGTYNSAVTYGNGYFAAAVNTSLYFGSRAIISKGVYIVPDRVGSNRFGGSRYFPYGEEQQVTAQDRDKFATYYRDSTTGLDYAQSRYYASTLGRFTSPDPYTASVGPADPGSWNRYSYTRGDPVNRYDPSGLDDKPPGLYLDLPTPNYWGGFAGPTTHSDWNEENQDQKGDGSFDATPNALKVLRELPNAIGLALKALANSDCSKLFSLTPDGLNPSFLLTQLSTGMSGYGYFQVAPIIPQAGTTTSATATQISSSVAIGNDAFQILGTGSYITINTLAGSFINGSLQDQAITILHELGHAFNQIYNSGGSLIKDDGTSVANHVQVSMDNTKLVKDNCFK